MADEFNQNGYGTGDGSSESHETGANGGYGSAGQSESAGGSYTSDAGTGSNAGSSAGSSYGSAGQNTSYNNGNGAYSTGNGNYQYSSGNGYNNGGYSDNGSAYNGNGGNYNGGNGGTQGGAGNGGSSNGDKDHHRKRGGAGKALFAVLLAVIFGVCAGAGAFGISCLYDDDSDTESETQLAENDGEDVDDDADEEVNENKADLKILSGDQIQTEVTQVAADVMPSIVSVYNTYTAQSQDFWGQVYSQEATSTGSGIIIANTGDELLIATNNHVIDDADSLEVQFIDETTAPANLKGTDSADDLAVIAVSLDDLDDDTLDEISVATLGSSDDLVIGEPVVAIGNALGYGQSVTTGVVSALNRELTTEDGETGTFIQTDAAINPGNSGGALVDLNGHVIGINSNKIGGTTVEGMGYAIPMSKAEPIIERLASQDTKTKVDESEQGYLGIAGVSVTSQVSSAYNMPQGAYVAQIYDGTGAADSDLQKGDIITAVNGTTVESMTDLKDELTYYAAGTEVTLTVQRADGSGDYSEQEIKLTLISADDMPSDEDAQASQSGNDQNDDKQSDGRQDGQNDDQGQGDGNGSGRSDEQAPAGNSSADGQEEYRGNGFYQFPWGSFFR